MSVSKKRRAKALRAFVERLTCTCLACYWWSRKREMWWLRSDQRFVVGGCEVRR